MGLNTLSHNMAIRLAQEYFVEIVKTSAILNKNSNPERVYEIISLNPKGLPTEPIEVIEMAENIQRKIKL